MTKPSTFGPHHTTDLSPTELRPYKDSPHQHNGRTKDNYHIYIISLGTTPDNFSENFIWFYRLKFLHGVDKIWSPVFDNSVGKIAMAVTKSIYQNNLLNINHRNLFTLLQLIVAYIRRFATSEKHNRKYTSHGSLHKS